MMKSTVLALALVALSATATSAADTAESLQKEATACAMGFATTQECAAECSMQTMAAGQPQACMPPDYANRALSVAANSASDLTPIQKAAMKCALDFQKTQQCGAGCQKVVVQGEEVCTAAGVGVDEATAAPAAETTAAPAADDATAAAAAEKGADADDAATHAATDPAPTDAPTDAAPTGAATQASTVGAAPTPNTAGTRDAVAVTGGPRQPAGGQSGHSESESEGSGGMFDGGMFDGMSAADQKELGVGGKGDKCKGFKLFLASEAANKKCEAFDTKTACEAGGCKYEDSECEPTAATMVKVMGVEMDQEKMQAEMAAKVKGAKTQEERTKITTDVMTKFLKPMVPVMNDMNATQVEIAKFMKRCGGGKAKAACTADKVCELQLKFNQRTDNFTQQCDVNKAKAVEETGCSGVAKAIADLDAIERKAVAAGAKKLLATRKTAQAAKAKKLTEAKKALADAKAAGQDTTNLQRNVDFAETEAAAADASVIAASATVATADADAAAAEKKADETPADSSTLRALPSIMAVVAATVAAAFA